MPRYLRWRRQPPLPASVLYYGKVEEIVRGEDGSILRLRMSSEKDGELVLNLSQDTVWIDSGRKAPGDPADIKEGESLYVFHSPVVTMSLPAQSFAFAVVWNVPMDAGCAQYHEVEEVKLADGQLRITTDNGALILLADAKTELSAYDGGTPPTLETIQAGDRVMVWSESQTMSEPAQAYAHHLMLLPQLAEDTEDVMEETEQAEDKALTRGELVALLHEQAGKPVVNYAMDYTDVEDGDPHAEAIRWAASEKLAGGYGDGSFGPENLVSREQLVTILWRQAGSPMLMDYTALSEYSDIGEMSSFAGQAMAWAHQKGIITEVEENVLAPRGTVTGAEAADMIEAAQQAR